MSKYECELCGYIYDPEIGDPESGIAPGTSFRIFRMTGSVRAVPSTRVCL